jgi:hypothetical protein
MRKNKRAERSMGRNMDTQFAGALDESVLGLRGLFSSRFTWQRKKKARRISAQIPSWNN